MSTANNGVKPEVTEMAAKLKKEITLDTATGIMTIPAAAYEKTLSDGLTVAIGKQLQDHNTTLTAAFALAVGEMGFDAMKKHKKLDRIEAEMPLIGKDTLNAVYSRKTMVSPGPNAKGDEQVPKYGDMKVKMHVYGATNHGELRKVKADLSARALEAFGD